MRPAHTTVARVGASVSCEQSPRRRAGAVRSRPDVASQAGCQEGPRRSRPPRADARLSGSRTDSRRIRKSRADMAHAYVGGVSPPALWQFGLGKTGRPAWPPPRRWGCANANEGTGRAGCGRSPRRGAWGGCTQTLECVESADDIVNRSDRRPLSPLWSQAVRARRLRKKQKSKPIVKCVT